MTIDVETDRVAKQIGGMTLLHSTECEIAGIKTTYLMYVLQYRDPKHAEWLYAIAIGEDDYRIRLFRNLRDAETVFKIASNNEIVSYVFDDILVDLGFDCRGI